jgi:hypothetical protein
MECCPINIRVDCGKNIDQQISRVGKISTIMPQLPF